MRILPKSRFISIIFILILLLLFWTAYTEVLRIPDHRAVNHLITKRLDVTGDGIADEIRLNIKGKSWNKPFKWTLVIISKDKTIFEHQSDDAWLDKFFNDKGYVQGGCETYLECKKEYYLNDMAEYIFVKTSLPDKGASVVVDGEAKEQLIKKFNLSAKDADKIVALMDKKLNTEEVQLLYVPKSPVQSESPKMYVEPLGQFVTIPGQ